MLSVICSVVSVCVLLPLAAASAGWARDDLEAQLAALAEANAEANAVEMPDFAGQHTSGISKRSGGAKVRLCGYQLVNAIKLACDYSGGRGKRSVQQDEAHPLFASVFRKSLFSAANANSDTNSEVADTPSLAEAMGVASWPAYSRFKTINMLQSLRKRGATDECCTKPCTLTHLETYC